MSHIYKDILKHDPRSCLCWKIDKMPCYDVEFLTLNLLLRTVKEQAVLAVNNIKPPNLEVGCLQGIPVAKALLI